MSGDSAGLGSAAFRRRYDLLLAYMAGAMAFGIASERLVAAMSGAGMLASFGAAGLDPARIGAAVARLRTCVPPARLCVNLIHSPDSAALERATVDLLIEAGVTAIEASAFMGPTAALVLYRARFARIDPVAGPLAPNRVIAKISRRAVAVQFLRPPPAELLAALVAQGALAPAEAEAAALLPLADDITVEADSGGHTDNQALLCAFPAIQALRQEVAAGFAPAGRVCLGAAGGIGTPQAVAAAFALGADYVVTGSINQACREAGTSEAVRRLLAELEPSDVAMAPAADMFEIGARVQVVRRGSLFAVRAQRLYELYRTRADLAALSDDEQNWLRTQVFGRPMDEVLAMTRAFWLRRDPAMVVRASSAPFCGPRRVRRRGRSATG